MLARLKVLAALLLLAVLGLPALLLPPAPVDGEAPGFALSADDGVGPAAALRPADRRLGPQSDWRSAPTDGEIATYAAARPPGRRCLTAAGSSCRRNQPRRPDCCAGASGNRGPPLLV